MKTSSIAPLALLLPLSLVACGGSDDEGSPDESATECEYTLTEFDGDCQGLEDPDPNEGFQIHCGPTDYDNPDEMAEFLLDPGAEDTHCLYFNSPNEEVRYVSGYNSHIRPGGHHLIVYQQGSDREDGYGACSTGADARFFVGANQPTIEAEIAGGMPEYAGAALKLDPQVQFAAELHMLNVTDEVALREFWVNMSYLPEQEVQVLLDPIFFIGGSGMNIAPGTSSLEGGLATAPQDLTIVALTGHMHSHGQRFSVYKMNGGADPTLLYETTEWNEPGQMAFSDSVDNPATEEESFTNRVSNGAWGASGVIKIVQGEQLRWECDFQNDEEFPLVFGDSAITDEMCNLFGFYAPSMGTPWRAFGLRPLTPL